MKMVAIVAASLALLVAVVLVWFAWASSSSSGNELESHEGAETISLPGFPVAAPPRAIKVLSWNIAFGGGAEGQPTGIYSAAHVQKNLEAIVEAIRRIQPDLVLVQEVDRGARRSGEVDQFRWLLEQAGLGHGCFVETWNVRYLPHPGWRPSGHLGRVRSGQVILSRFPIRSCRRQPLPQPIDAPWWYLRFFLHRAAQWAEIDLGEAGVLTAVNVHLEAFYQDNREEQARLLASRLLMVPDGRLLVVGGDFNAVPESASRKRDFPDEPETDFSSDRTLHALRAVPGLREVFLDDAADAPEEASLTFPAPAPSRRLDYVFYRGFPGSSQRAVPRVLASDHRPVEAALLLPEREGRLP